MWQSVDFDQKVTVRFDLNTLTEDGTVARCAIVLPNSKVNDLGMCRIRRTQDDDFEELRLENTRSGLRFTFIRMIG